MWRSRIRRSRRSAAPHGPRGSRRWQHILSHQHQLALRTTHTTHLLPMPPPLSQPHPLPPLSLSRRSECRGVQQSVGGSDHSRGGQHERTRDRDRCCLYTGGERCGQHNTATQRSLVPPPYNPFHTPLYTTSPHSSPALLPLLLYSSPFICSRWGGGQRVGLSHVRSHG